MLKSLQLRVAAVTGLTGLIVAFLGMGLAQARQVLQSLPNDTYLFQQSSNKYVILRKTGRTVVGRYFQYQTDDVYCFKGRASGDAIVNLIAENVGPLGEPPPPNPFVSGNPLSLKGYRLVRINQAPRDVAPLQDLRRCQGLSYKL